MKKPPTNGFASLWPRVVRAIVIGAGTFACGLLWSTHQDVAQLKTNVALITQYLGLSPVRVTTGPAIDKELSP